MVGAKRDKENNIGPRQRVSLTYECLVNQDCLSGDTYNHKRKYIGYY